VPRKKASSRRASLKLGSGGEGARKFVVVDVRCTTLFLPTIECLLGRCIVALPTPLPRVPTPRRIHYHAAGEEEGGGGPTRAESARGQYEVHTQALCRDSTALNAV
jgi:hypothetical protein